MFIEKEQIIIFPPVKNTPVIVRSNSFMGEYGSIEGTVVNVEEALPRKTDKIFAKLGFKPKPKYDVSVSVEPDFTTRWHPLTIIIKGVIPVTVVLYLILACLQNQLEVIDYLTKK